MTESTVGRFLALIGTILLAASGCSESSGPEKPDALPARVRIVNSVYRGTATTAVPVSIDYLIDGAIVAPGTATLTGNSITSGVGPGSYQDVSVGVHSLVARVAGQSSKTDSLYTTPEGSPWVPRLYLTANSHYTIVVSGVIPAAGTAFNNSVPFAAVVDDPFPPVTVGGNYQARFRVINAAPFGSVSGNGTSVNVFITPGATPPTTLTTISTLASAQYRSASAYLNVEPGTYVLTLAVGTATILSQSTVTFAAGEVRTFILQSTGPRTPAGAANHKLTAVLDRQY
jgi:hypothetical protein